MKIVGKYMDLALQANPTGLRLFSPDELESNKLNAVFEHTSRNFQWDGFSFGQGGRVIEILSEHTCQSTSTLSVRFLSESLTIVYRHDPRVHPNRTDGTLPFV